VEGKATQTTGVVRIDQASAQHNFPFFRVERKGAGRGVGKKVVGGGISKVRGKSERDVEGEALLSEKMPE